MNLGSFVWTYIFWEIFCTRPKYDLCLKSELCSKLDVDVQCRLSNLFHEAVDQNIKVFSVLNFTEWDKDEEVNETKNVIVFKCLFQTF